MSTRPSNLNYDNENFALQFLNFELNLCRKGQTINYYANKFLRCQAKLQVRIKNITQSLAGSVHS